MKNSWRQFFRRLMAGCAVFVSAAWSSAMCYAQVAADFATDPAYADGWQAGDNGGNGFQPWSFDNDGGTAGTHTIDSTSPFNNLGTAWRIAVDPDITRAGRGFSPLQVGQTLRMVVDNPSEIQFFKGYIIRLNTGGGNICYNEMPCTPGTAPKERLGIYTFEYFTYGDWLVSDLADDNFQTTLASPDTDMGLQIDVTLTGAETYSLKMTPLDSPNLAYMQSGSLGNAGTGTIDWLEFVFFNTPSDPAADTDFYIKRLEIIGSAPPGVPGDYNKNGTVDAADYVLWRDTVGQSGANLPADGTGDNQVDATDYNFWRARFGRTSGSGSLSSASVPEPPTACALLLSSSIVCLRKRSRQAHP